MNKPGSDVEDLKGGVAGGSILKGNEIYSLNFLVLPILHFSIANALSDIIYRSAQSWTRNRS